jgi:hypothetical protein
VRRALGDVHGRLVDADRVLQHVQQLVRHDEIRSVGAELHPARRRARAGVGVRRALDAHLREEVDVDLPVAVIDRRRPAPFAGLARKRRLEDLPDVCGALRRCRVRVVHEEVPARRRERRAVAHDLRDRAEVARRRRGRRQGEKRQDRGGAAQLR